MKSNTIIDLAILAAGGNASAVNEEFKKGQTTELLMEEVEAQIYVPILRFINGRFDEIEIKDNGTYELTKYATLLLDENLKGLIKDDVAEICNGQMYQCYSTDVESNDTTIIPALKITQLQLAKKLLAVAAYFIALDSYFQGGFLQKLAARGQQNLNLGYCLLKDKDGNEVPHVVYLERLDKVKEGKREYHIHTSTVPRPYKKNRHHLVPEVGR